MVFRYILTVLIGVLVSGLVHAKPMDFSQKDDKPKGYLLSGFKSKHFGTEEKYNEQNDGLGYMTLDGLFGGVYKNSLGKTSLYGGKEMQSDPYKLGPIELRALFDLGAVTGYKKPITPIAMPGLGISFDDYMVALGLIPPIKNVTPATLSLQLRKKF